MPVIVCTFDPSNQIEFMLQKAPEGSKMARWKPILSSFTQMRPPLPSQGLDFSETNFAGNMCTLLDNIKDCIPTTGALHVEIIAAEAQHSFSEKVRQELAAHGLSARLKFCNKRRGVGVTDGDVAVVEANESFASAKVDALDATSLYRTEAQRPEDTLALLRNLFDAADVNGSRTLERSEIAEIVQAFYKAEKTSRKLSVVQEEVNKALLEFDANGDGTLQFEEFVAMFCGSDSFHFNLSRTQRELVHSAIRGKHEEAAVMLPVLSAEFLCDPECFKAMWRGHRRGASVLPILHSYDSYSDFLRHKQNHIPNHPELAKSLPFLCSVLNRANRVPPSSDFEAHHAMNMTKLQEALSRLLLRGNSEQAALKRRVPKYHSLIPQAALLPVTGSFGVKGPGGGSPTVRANLKELIRRILPEEPSMEAAEQGAHNHHRGHSISQGDVKGPLCLTQKVNAICAIDGSAASKALARDLELELRQVGVEMVTPGNDDVAWWQLCETCTHTVVLLSGAFVASHVCEGQLTYSKDHGHTLVYVVLDDLSFTHVMSTSTFDPQNKPSDASERDWQALAVQAQQEAEDLRRELETVRTASRMRATGASGSATRGNPEAGH